MTTFFRPTIAEINLDAVKSNVRHIRDMVGPKIKIMPIVKANAYGHGAIPVARAIEPEVDAFGVAFVYEGIELRRGGIQCPVLVMAGAPDTAVKPALENNLIFSVGDLNMASCISRAAQGEGVAAKVHIEVDTGMGRLGICWKEAAQEIIRICELPNMEVEGIYSHLATSEVKQDTYTFLQLERFHTVLEALEKRKVFIPVRHLANSAAILQYPETWFDLIRPGLMIYGIYPSEHLKHKISLQFPLTIKTRIIQIRSFEKGESISYGRTFVCPHPKRIAAIPVGYADGFSRVLSNRVGVLVRNTLAPVVGTICMDMCMIDITHIPEAAVDDEVILVGGGKGGIMVEKLAGLMDTIPYEVLCSVGRRVRRVYRGNNGQGPSII